MQKVKIILQADFGPYQTVVLGAVQVSQDQNPILDVTACCYTNLIKKGLCSYVLVNFQDMSLT